jgi:hypothetical protein
MLTIGFYKHSAPLEPDHNLVATQVALCNLRIYFFSEPLKCFRMNEAIFQASMAFQGRDAIV